MKINWKKEVILITGASSGLGKALALAGGKLGATVLLVFCCCFVYPTRYAGYARK